MSWIEGGDTKRANGEREPRGRSLRAIKDEAGPTGGKVRGLARHSSSTCSHRISSLHSYG